MKYPIWLYNALLFCNKGSVQLHSNFIPRSKDIIETIWIFNNVIHNWLDQTQIRESKTNQRIVDYLFVLMARIADWSLLTNHSLKNLFIRLRGLSTTKFSQVKEEKYHQYRIAVHQRLVLEDIRLEDIRLGMKKE